MKTMRMIMLGLLSAFTVFAAAQNYPTKPVRMVVGDPGGSTDFIGRLVAKGFSLGQPMIVQNHGGSDQPLVVSHAPPDGHSLLLLGSVVWLLPYLQDNCPYDPIRDFAPITLATAAPNVLVVHPSSPVKSVKELIALAKAKPGELNFSSSPAGGSSHMAGELFKAMAGINVVWIPYKGSSQALVALLGNEVQMTFASPLPAAPLIKSGKLRALAVTSAQPSALAPGIPPVASEGLPGYESQSMQGIWAPAKTSAAIIRRLNEDFVRTLRSADVKQKVFDSGSEAVGTSPQEFDTIIRTDMNRMGKVIKDAGIRVD